MLHAGNAAACLKKYGLLDSALREWQDACEWHAALVCLCTLFCMPATWRHRSSACWCVRLVTSP